MSNEIKEFNEYGMQASMHYADSASDLGDGAECKRKALEIFDANPAQQSDMREIAKHFLWSLSDDRPR